MCWKKAKMPQCQQEESSDLGTWITWHWITGMRSLHLITWSSSMFYSSDNMLCLTFGESGNAKALKFFVPWKNIADLDPTELGLVFAFLI